MIRRNILSACAVALAAAPSNELGVSAASVKAHATRTNTAANLTLQLKSPSEIGSSEQEESEVSLDTSPGDGGEGQATCPPARKTRPGYYDVTREYDSNGHLVASATHWVGCTSEQEACQGKQLNQISTARERGMMRARCAERDGTIQPSASLLRCRAKADELRAKREAAAEKMERNTPAAHPPPAYCR